MLDLFLSPFEGFHTADFNAYTQDKWASNLHNRQRMSVRDKLNAIGRHVRDRWAVLDPEASAPLSFETNDPGPSVFNSHRVDAQWLFFTRSEEDKKRLFTVLEREKSVAQNLSDAAHHKRHLILALRIDAAGAAVMLALHGNAHVDLRNALKKLEDPALLQHLSSLLQALHPTEPALHLDLNGLPLSQLDALTVQQRLLAITQGQAEWLNLGVLFPADADLAPFDPGFQDLVADLLFALLPLYRFLAWSSDNDFMALGQELLQQKEQVLLQSTPIQPGDLVLITAGLFNGKQGVVKDIDKKGMYRVAVDKMLLQLKPLALQKI